LNQLMIYFVKLYYFFFVKILMRYNLVQLIILINDYIILLMIDILCCYLFMRVIS